MTTSAPTPGGWRPDRAGSLPIPSTRGVHADPEPALNSRPLVEAFPKPGPVVESAYRPLDSIVENPQANPHGPALVHLLPRPWDPATCTDPVLRAGIWQWLERVVIWLNLEYAWGPDEAIPACWPKHPHLVHELAVLADQRRSAGRAPGSGPLEEWHRGALPQFIERMRHRLGPHCQDREHQPWPARSTHVRYLMEPSAQERSRNFAADVASAEMAQPL